MTVDELVSIWNGSANWWLKSEGDSDYFFQRLCYRHDITNVFENP